MTQKIQLRSTFLKHDGEVFIKANLPKKIFINNAFYLLPITILLYLMFYGFSKDIDFADKEILGADINSSAIKLLVLKINKSQNSSDQKQETEFLVGKKRKYLEALRLTENALIDKNKKNLIDEGSLDKIENLTDLVSYVGDSSNLILDPDLDSYYVMDATIYAIPQILNRVNEINNFLESNSAKLSNMELKDSMKLNSLVEIITSVDLPRLMGDIDTAIKEDKNFHKENAQLQKDIAKKLSNFDLAMKNYINILKNINSIQKLKENELSDARLKMLDSLLVFELAGIDTLKQMLMERIDDIKTSRTKSIGMGILAILFALAVSAYITKTIRSDLNNLIKKMKSNSEEVDTTSMDNSNISTELSNAVNEQASSVQQISSTTEEISQMSQKNNENVKISMQATNETVKSVVNSNQLINDLDLLIVELKKENDRIIQKSQENSKNFESIFSIIKNIEEKTKIINDIVFQTKLLSFNASVEAARAGEQGKGFAVVADEIGNLAQMSGKAAQEISLLLDSSARKVRELTTEADQSIKIVVENSSKKIEVAVEKVDYCKNSYNVILKNSERINQLIGEVVQASDEQTKGVVEITSTLNSFNQTTDRNSKLATDLNNSAKLLSDKSKDLKLVIENLLELAGS